jgi:hypothetical protein
VVEFPFLAAPDAQAINHTRARERRAEVRDTSPGRDY